MLAFYGLRGLTEIVIPAGLCHWPVCGTPVNFY